jgi:hypothetical protein
MVRGLPRPLFRQWEWGENFVIALSGKINSIIDKCNHSGDKMQRHADSHLDHGLTPAQVAYLMDRFASRGSFFAKTIELPIELGTVPCGLYGPMMGDMPVNDTECTNEVRGERSYASRMVNRPTRETRQVSVIAGPHGDLPCVLYTAFGGPIAPQEPGDPGCRDIKASVPFWEDHALAR